MSEHIEDPSAGMNGSFEVVSEGLPVNWLVYTPNTVPEGEFEIVLDKDDFYHGEQSIKFIVKGCSSTGGWQSPGFAQEIPAEPGEKYQVSFWIKNDGTDFTVSAGAVGPKTGKVKTLLETEQTIDKWRHYEYVVSIPQDYKSIRFEVGILSPGTFWIDHVRILKI